MTVFGSRWDISGKQAADPGEQIGCRPKIAPMRMQQLMESIFPQWVKSSSMPERIFSIPPEKPFRRGQADAARIPVQQPEADFILPPVQLLLQGGRRDEQGFGGGVDAGVLGNGDEGVQILGIHGRPRQLFKVERFSFSLLYKKHSSNASPEDL
jgi:hypothetical protein